MTDMMTKILEAFNKISDINWKAVHGEYVTQDVRLAAYEALRPEIESHERDAAKYRITLADYDMISFDAYSAEEFDQEMELRLMSQMEAEENEKSNER